MVAKTGKLWQENMQSVAAEIAIFPIFCTHSIERFFFHFAIAEKSKRCSSLPFDGARAYVRGFGRFGPVRLVVHNSGSIFTNKYLL